MRYWYAPLRKPPDDLFTSSGTRDPRDKENTLGPSGLLYVGEITEEVYSRMQVQRENEKNGLDELGLPLTNDNDDLGLPL